jgi:hypothetical protein
MGNRGKEGQHGHGGAIGAGGAVLTLCACVRAERRDKSGRRPGVLEPHTGSPPTAGTLNPPRPTFPGTWSVHGQPALGIPSGPSSRTGCQETHTSLIVISNSVRYHNSAQATRQTL